MTTSLFSEIVSEGLLQAGDTSLTTRANAALKWWLRSQARGFMWPKCKDTDNFSINAGSESFTLGGGEGGVVEEIWRINDPMKIFSGSGANVADFQNIRIQTDWDDSLINPFAGGRGLPTEARVREMRSVKGGWEVNLNHEADKAYTIQVSYFVIPLDPSTSAVPWYPNDRTMVQAVYVEALKYKKDKSYREELDLLAAMVRQDRLSESQKEGISIGPSLNPRVFR